jgi:pentatricopeptide repeat protein
LAFYLAHQSKTEHVHEFLDLASEVAETAEDWRRDAIRVKIAKTYTLLGQTARATEYERDVVDSETGKVAGVKAMMSDDESFENQLLDLDTMIATGNYDIMRNALDACGQLYNRFYADQAKRDQAEAIFQSALSKVPVITRLELIMGLIVFTLEHEDQAKALTLTDEAQKIFESHQWPAEFHLSLAAKLTILRYRSGDHDIARTHADTLLTYFKEQGDMIVDIWRAGALRPLAEAYQKMGDTDSALAVYHMVIEEGCKNPNSRPRAEDLCATCISMALSETKPNSQLMTRIYEIYQCLGQPW